MSLHQTLEIIVGTMGLCYVSATAVLSVVHLYKYINAIITPQHSVSSMYHINMKLITA